jgi:hypothetical protein
MDKMAATTPLPEDLWPQETDLIPKVQYDLHPIPLSDLYKELIYHVNEMERKMAVVELCWPDPF